MAELNADRQLFIASTFKAYVLAEYLRSAEESIDPQGDVAIADQLAAEMARKLVLDESIFCLSSPVFNPPDLSGLVPTRTTFEAMVARSDNTATDMILKQVGHERVQAFVDRSACAPRRSPPACGNSSPMTPASPSGRPSPGINSRRHTTARRIRSSTT